MTALTERAARARHALRAYVPGPDADSAHPEDVQDAIIDLVTDLMHLADQLGVVDFAAAIVDRAERHHDSEQKEHQLAAQREDPLAVLAANHWLRTAGRGCS